MPINIEKSLRAGIHKDLMDTWRNKYPIFEKQQSLLIRPLGKINLRKAEYVWKESLPMVEPWPYGTARGYREFQDRSIFVSTFPYTLNMLMSGWDVSDDQLGDLKSHTQSASKRFLQLPDVLLAEYLNGTASYNPSLAVAYDGASIFSATTGSGGNRMGVSGGNILVGSGLTPAAIAHDLARAQQRFMGMKDTASQILFDPDDVAYTNMHCIYPKELNEAFQKLANNEFMRTDTQNITSESNYLKGQFKLDPNTRLTSAVNWFIVLEHEYWKAFVSRTPSNEGELRQLWADMNNSDQARLRNEQMSYADARLGLGPWFPGVIIEVTNA